MKKVLPLLFAIFIVSFPAYLKSQDAPWLEVGSEWTYQHGVWSGPEHFQITYGITEQTTFAGEECAKMERTSPNALGCISLQSPFYFYVSNDSLFYANESDSTFRLVADFGASVGDSWEYLLVTDYNNSIAVDTFMVNVASVNLIDIESYELRHLELDYEWIGSSSDEELWLGLYTGDLTEVIGGGGFFAPFGQLGFCDYETSVVLQCFESPSLSYLNPEYPSCNYVVSLKDSELAENLVVFPNPASDVINIEMPPLWIGEEVSLQLYDSRGGLIVNRIKQFRNTHTIAVAELKKGIYFLSAETNSQRRTTKIMVNK